MVAAIGVVVDNCARFGGGCDEDTTIGGGMAVFPFGWLLNTLRLVMAERVLLMRFGFFICCCCCAGGDVMGMIFISTLLFLLHNSLRTRFLSHFSATAPCRFSVLLFGGLVDLPAELCASSVHVDVWLNGEPGSDASLVAVESALIVTTPLQEKKEEDIINLAGSRILN